VGQKKKLNFVDQFYLPNGQTINAGATEGYFEGKRRGKVTKGILFLHDIAPGQWALAT
jgi:hypothetical protein